MEKLISDCMCPEHKKMITDISMDELNNISSTALKRIEDLNELIEGLSDPVFHIAQLFMQHEGRPLADILKDFEKVRDNTQKIFDIAQEEIKKRLSTDDVKCLVPWVKGFTTHVHANGTITRTREIKNDNK